MRKITIYRNIDGRWALRPAAAHDAIEAELEDGYLPVQGSGGPPRVLSSKHDELGMTIEQAIQRGLLRLVPREEMRTDRPTMLDPKEHDQRLPKPGT